MTWITNLSAGKHADQTRLSDATEALKWTDEYVDARDEMLFGPT
jgi:hypothetical protein